LGKNGGDEEEILLYENDFEEDLMRVPHTEQQQGDQQEDRQQQTQQQQDEQQQTQEEVGDGQEKEQQLEAYGEIILSLHDARTEQEVGENQLLLVDTVPTSDGEQDDVGEMYQDDDGIIEGLSSLICSVVQNVHTTPKEKENDEQEKGKEVLDPSSLVKNV